MGSEIDSHCLRKYDCLEGLVLKTFGTRFHAGCLGHSRRGTEHWRLEVFKKFGIFIKTNRFSKYWSLLIDLSQNGGCPNVCPTPSSGFQPTWFIEPDQCGPRLPKRGSRSLWDPRTFKEMRFIFSFNLCGSRGGPAWYRLGDVKTPHQCIKRLRDSETRSRWQFRTFIAIRGGRHAFKMLGLRAATIS